MTRSARGFTLLEVLLALAIVGALVTIAFGGMRVALAAWRQGEDRAEAHQHVRSAALTLGRAVAAAYPYRASRGLAPEPVLLFEGAAQRIAFVTQSPPFASAAPIAFTAVVIELQAGDEPGLVVRQRPLPNRDPFEKAEVVFRDTGVTGFEVRYLDDAGTWQEEWKIENDKGPPRAVRLSIETSAQGRAVRLPPLTVNLRTAPPQ
jgi:prepilin-type N-terminal cleavage/methylation domain-containing protein